MTVSTRRTIIHPLSHQFWHCSRGPQTSIEMMPKKKSLLYGDLYRCMQQKHVDANEARSLLARCEDLGPSAESNERVYRLGTSYLWGMVTKVFIFPSFSTLVKQLRGYQAL